MWNRSLGFRKSAGLLLIEAKSQVPHGMWGNYLERHKISQSTANGAMSFAQMTTAEQKVFLQKDAERKKASRTGAKFTGHPANLNTDPPQSSGLHSVPCTTPKQTAVVTSPDHTGLHTSHQATDAGTDTRCSRIHQFTTRSPVNEIRIPIRI